MNSIFGITNLQIATFSGPVSEVAEDVNAFLQLHDGNIVNVMAVPPGGDIRGINVVVLYKKTEEVFR